MAKKVLAVVKVNIEAGKASPAPPVGTALGPHGIAIMDFCRQYNERTSESAGQIVPAEITIYEDRSFSFILKTPPTSFLVREAADIEKGAGEVGREFVGAITDAQLASIAAVKLPDLNTDDIEMAKRQVAGTARSMGVRVVRG
ncbi:MAG: 50S ribosomal protein L11 [bacterium]|nr:50S ribosomal protein L11 [bacterium]MDE0668280.1 50S ribosomal protein L11 [bacterium]MXZ31004.1 50S ribosomal protein L11 [Acidimicrobiia bacterium]